MVLTLVPGALAHKGARFTFKGPNAGPECEGCPYQKLCFGLLPGHAYEVKGLRDVTHPCGLHDEAKVHVVEVVEIPFDASLETKHLRGTAAPWVAPPCGRPDCVSYGLCHPVGPVSGARHAIIEAGDAMACPAGYELVKVKLQKMQD